MKTAIQVRVSAAEKKRAAQYARELGLSVSSFIRFLLARWTKTPMRFLAVAEKSWEEREVRRCKNRKKRKSVRS